jgi:hypothetical protein
VGDDEALHMQCPEIGRERSDHRDRPADLAPQPEPQLAAPPRLLRSRRLTVVAEGPIAAGNGLAPAFRRRDAHELAAVACSTLDALGIAVVLSGGAVVSICSDAAYVSDGLDLIPVALARKADRAMESLAFERARHHSTHPRSRHWVEFRPGPVAIGEQTIRTFAERETVMGAPRLIALAECVMDGLAWYLRDADTQCLEQAVEEAGAGMGEDRPVVQLPSLRTPGRFRQNPRRPAAVRTSRRDAATGIERYGMSASHPRCSPRYRHPDRSQPVK